MKFVSTRGKAPAVSFEEAIIAGMAPDGGLYVPEKFEEGVFSESVPETSREEIAVQTLSPFIQEEIPEEGLRSIIHDGLSFPFPLVQVGGKYILELFHGPTRAFKDVAAQILPRIMQYFLQKQNRSLTILTATSGDTGGAVAHGFGDLEGITVVILFPKGKVSGLQYEQLTRVAANVISLEVDGTFDDCQKIVKEAFNDPDLSKLNLTSANSINIGRLLPQMVYYAYVAHELRDKKLRFVVPSGNMGNVTAGLYTKRSGASIESFLVACNANDPVVQYLQTGKYRPQKPIQTLSTAMDIGNPSNFERILHLYSNTDDRLKNDIDAVTVTDDETINTIKTVHNRYGYLLDPHTAVAWTASEKRPGNVTDIIVATAHPTKFADEIHHATAIRVPHENMQIPYTKNVTLVFADLSTVKATILKKIAK